MKIIDSIDFSYPNCKGIELTGSAQVALLLVAIDIPGILSDPAYEERRRSFLTTSFLN